MTLQLLTGYIFISKLLFWEILFYITKLYNFMVTFSTFYLFLFTLF
ncbi:hypothetical protein ANASTE_01911 [Anaerofustis stercorihominis DSM 17244]|uniref:Uncharacterized protein n=1 Tax=Anaerofustis stercorihominis DSM 17244 TaxID=445971 RepID=B1C9Y5_9FIRM|nr:hypothetical protein ANASTE_01911 [Anaerofustis stercorihominis DSM 17244]